MLSTTHFEFSRFRKFCSFWWLNFLKVSKWKINDLKMQQISHWSKTCDLTIETFEACLNLNALGLISLQYVESRACAPVYILRICACSKHQLWSCFTIYTRRPRATLLYSSGACPMATAQIQLLVRGSRKTFLIGQIIRWSDSSPTLDGRSQSRRGCAEAFDDALDGVEDTPSHIYLKGSSLNS